MITNNINVTHSTVEISALKFCFELYVELSSYIVKHFIDIEYAHMYVDTMQRLNKMCRIDHYLF